MADAPSPRPPRPAWAPLAAVALAVGGLAVSAALLVDYLGPTPAYCAEGGCATVRESSWAKPLGVPLPALGVLFFAAAIALAAAGPRLAMARRLHAGLGAAIAITLLVVQGAVVGAWCKLCVVTDSLAILHAVVVLSTRTQAWPGAPRRRAGVFAAVAVAAFAIPLLGMTKAKGPASGPVEGGLPPVIAALQKPGVVTVVDFADFQCPHCRTFHTRMVEAFARVDAPLNIVRKMVPLDIHEHAMPAALAWCCADVMGKGEPMADALFTVAVDDLTTTGCEKVAATVGLDVPAFRACVADPATAARIEADRKDAEAAGLRSLPTVFIGEERFQGAAATVDELEASVRRALLALK